MAGVLQMRNHVHEWGEPYLISCHAGDSMVSYVRCIHCKQVGFRKPPSPVVYTWEQNKEA